MKKLFMPLLFGVALLFVACSSDDDNGNNNGIQTANFTVTIENVVTPKPIFQSGVFNTPMGATSPAPIFPGDTYQFDIDAGPSVTPMDGGTRLSFVTMFVQSNDLFLAPDEDGIALYSNGMPIGANGPIDVTSQILLWDSGTEVNEITGGPNQKPQQSMTAADQGVDENGVVTRIINNMDTFGNVLPNVNAVINVTIENIASARFRVKIMNVSTGTTIATPGLGAGTTAAVPMSPGVYAVHTGTAPFFVEGMAASAAGSVGSTTGVEDIAEDGFPDALALDTTTATGLIVPLSPGVYAIHMQGFQPLYQINSPDYGDGLEGIAEDGIPTTLATSLAANPTVNDSGAFDTAVGASGPGAIGPGGSYQFSFMASSGQNLSLATMFVQSNDWVYAFSPDGLPLFLNGQAVTGDVTSQIFLYDVGTEMDEYPGAGLNQVIRQGSADTGMADSNTNVRLITPSSQMNVPTTASTIKVTISTQ